MPFYNTNGLRVFAFDIFSGEGLTQAVFTRRGGVSPRPWAELNVGGTVGDDPARVAENRRRAFQVVQRPGESLYDVWQVHGNRVVLADRPRPPDQPHQKADAILTASPGVTLFMRFADCVPIFLYDPQQGVAGLVHAGWKGTVTKTAAAAVEQMSAVYHSRPADILAGIGPSIGAHHYPVGGEVVARVEAAFGPEGTEFLESKDAAETYFDLWAANRKVLADCGVERIEVAGLCTACHPEDWFSHRGEAGKTGRFGALIGLL